MRHLLKEQEQTGKQLAKQLTRLILSTYLFVAIGLTLAEFAVQLLHEKIGFYLIEALHFYYH